MRMPGRHFDCMRAAGRDADLIGLLAPCPFGDEKAREVANMPLSMNSRQMGGQRERDVTEEMNETEAVETEPANERGQPAKVLCDPSQLGMRTTKSAG